MYMYICELYSGAGKDRKRKKKAKWRELHRNTSRKQDKYVQEIEGKRLLQFIYEAWRKLNPYRSRTPRQQWWDRRREKKEKPRDTPWTRRCGKRDRKMLWINNGQKRRRERKQVLFRGKQQTQQKRVQRKQGLRRNNQYKSRKAFNSSKWGRDEGKGRNKATTDDGLTGREQTWTRWAVLWHKMRGESLWAAHLILSVCGKSQQKETAVNVKQLRKRKRKETSPENHHHHHHHHQAVRRRAADTDVSQDVWTEKEKLTETEKINIDSCSEKLKMYER